jgi:transcriptional regulator with XRE-family HTH domain
MIIGERLREIREQKNLSQGHIEQKTGLLRCYVSRVENAHTVPSIETLEKWARALEVPLFKLFMDENAKIPRLAGSVTAGNGKSGRLFSNLHRHVEHMSARDQKLLVCFAAQLSRRHVRQRAV